LEKPVLVTWKKSRANWKLRESNTGRKAVIGATSSEGCVLARQFCQLTRDGEVYHDYCLNYSKAVNYLDQLRKNEDFCDFEKVSDTVLLTIQ